MGEKIIIEEINSEYIEYLAAEVSMLSHILWHYCKSKENAKPYIELEYIPDALDMNIYFYDIGSGEKRLMHKSFIKTYGALGIAELIKRMIGATEAVKENGSFRIGVEYDGKNPKSLIKATEFIPAPGSYIRAEDQAQILNDLRSNKTPHDDDQEKEKDH